MAFRIRTKLVIAFLIMLIPFFAIIAANHIYHRSLYNNIHFVEDISREISYRSKFQLALDQMLMPANDYLITGDAAERDRFMRLSSEAEGVLDKFSAQLTHRHESAVRVGAFERLFGARPYEAPSEELALLKEMKGGLAMVRSKGAEILKMENPVGSKAGAVLMEEMDSIADKLINEDISRSIVIHEKKLFSAIEDSDRIQARSQVLLAASFALSLSFGIVFAFFYTRLFTAPIMELHNGTEKLASGNLDYRVDIHTGDELEQCAASFNAMGERLKGFYAILEERVRERTRELRVERDKLFGVFNAMADGVYIVNRSYDIEYINPAIEKEFGPYEGRKCYEYFHDRTDVCPWCPNKEVWAGQTIRWEWFSKKNGKTYDLIDTPLKNPDGTVSKLEIFRDITDGKRAETEMKKRVEDLERFHRAAMEREFRIRELKDRLAGLEKDMEGLKKR